MGCPVRSSARDRPSVEIRVNSTRALVPFDSGVRARCRSRIGMKRPAGCASSNVAVRRVWRTGRSLKHSTASRCRVSLAAASHARGTAGPSISLPARPSRVGYEYQCSHAHRDVSMSVHRCTGALARPRHLRRVVACARAVRYRPPTRLRCALPRAARGGRLGLVQIALPHSASGTVITL